MSHPSSTVTMPEVIHRQQIRANLRYPQTNIGFRLLVGNTAMQLMQEGAYTWEELANIEPTEAQLQETMDITAKMHRHLKVPCHLTREDTDKRMPGRHYRKRPEAGQRVASCPPREPRHNPTTPGYPGLLRRGPFCGIAWYPRRNKFARFA